MSNSRNHCSLTSIMSYYSKSRGKSKRLTERTTLFKSLRAFQNNRARNTRNRSKNSRRRFWAMRHSKLSRFSRLSLAEDHRLCLVALATYPVKELILLSSREECFQEHPWTMLRTRKLSVERWTPVISSSHRSTRPTRKIKGELTRDKTSRLRVVALPAVDCKTHLTQ